jgi:hypothetical protein
MSYLRYLCLFTHSGVQYILCCVFCLVFLRLVYHMLPVSLNCPFVIGPLVFSNVYFTASQFLNNVINIKTNVLIPQIVETAEALWFSCC